MSFLEAKQEKKVGQMIHVGEHIGTAENPGSIAVVVMKANFVNNAQKLQTSLFLFGRCLTFIEGFHSGLIGSVS